MSSRQCCLFYLFIINSDSPEDTKTNNDSILITVIVCLNEINDASMPQSVCFSLIKGWLK